MLGEQLNKTRVVGENIDGPGFNFSKHPLMEVRNLERHAAC
jgi:hypothetical protein